MNKPIRSDKKMLKTNESYFKLMFQLT